MTERGAKKWTVRPYGGGTGSIWSAAVTLRGQTEDVNCPCCGQRTPNKSADTGYVHYHGRRVRGERSNPPYFCTSCQSERCRHVIATRKRSKNGNRPKENS